jgi:TPR repeat protein
VVLDNDEIVRLIKRGNDLLNVGDFAAARLLFARAADGGSADAALALGSTYDPLVIKKLGAFAVTPDIEKARKWYQIAADRGSSAASLQLANLAHAR